MTIAHFLEALVRFLYQLGAHHAYASVQGKNGYAVTHHFFTVVCRIPAGFHGIYRCSGWVKIR